MYIYDIQTSIRRELCMILDMDPKYWQDLASKTGIFTTLEIQHLNLEYQRIDGSPTEKLLLKWGHRNPSVDELVSLLLQLNLNRAADILKNYVTPTFYKIHFENKDTYYKLKEQTKTLQLKTTFHEEDELPLPKYTDSDSKIIKENKSNPQIKNFLNDINSNFIYEPEKILELSNKEVINSDSDRTLVHYKYDELVLSNTNLDNLLIGEGGFGKVYKIRLQYSFVALKIIKKSDCEFELKSFLTELTFLQKLDHKNIIKLYGVSVDKEFCLVYEYMVNGSLYDRLDTKDNTKPLSWKERLHILKDAATGLNFMHTYNLIFPDTKPLIHGDIKSSNIVIDGFFNAKLTDFGLAKEANKGLSTGVYSHKSKTDSGPVLGSKAYLPDEFLREGCSYNLKTDVYSFGIVIFEACTGEKPYDEKRESFKNLKDYISSFENSNIKSKIIYSLRDNLVNDWPDRNWLQLLNFGKLCTEDKKRARPSMTLVVDNLAKIIKEDLYNLKTNDLRKISNKEVREPKNYPSNILPEDGKIIGKLDKNSNNEQIKLKNSYIIDNNIFGVKSNSEKQNKIHTLKNQIEDLTFTIKNNSNKINGDKKTDNDYLQLFDDDNKIKINSNNDKSRNNTVQKSNYSSGRENIIPQVPSNLKCITKCYFDPLHKNPIINDVCNKNNKNQNIYESNSDKEFSGRKSNLSNCSGSEFSIISEGKHPDALSDRAIEQELNKPQNYDINLNSLDSGDYEEIKDYIDSNFSKNTLRQINQNDNENINFIHKNQTDSFFSMNTMDNYFEQEDSDRFAKLEILKRSTGD